MALSMACKQHLWLTGAFKELQGPNFAAALACDNKGTVDLIYNPRISDKSKHIDVIYYHLRDSVEEGKLVVIHVPDE